MWQMSGFQHPSSRVARQRRQVVFRVCVCVCEGLGPHAWGGLELSNFGKPSAWSWGFGGARCPSELLGVFYGSSGFLTIIYFLLVYSRVVQESLGLLVQFYGFSPFFSLIYFLIVISGGVHVSLIASGSVFWILSAFYSGHILSPFAHSLGGPLAPGGL